MPLLIFPNVNRLSKVSFLVLVKNKSLQLIVSSDTQNSFYFMGSLVFVFSALNQL
jgi:hypothetical protein